MISEIDKHSFLSSGKVYCNYCSLALAAEQKYHCGYCGGKIEINGILFDNGAVLCHGICTNCNSDANIILDEFDARQLMAEVKSFHR